MNVVTNIALMAAVAALVASLGGCGRQLPFSPSPISAAPGATVNVPDYSGSRTGQFRVAACTGQRHCNELRGTEWNYELNLAQNGRDLFGTFATQGLTFTIEGHIADNGTASFTGAGRTEVPWFPQPTVGMTEMKCQRGADDRLIATFTYELRFSESAEVGHLNDRLQTVTGEIFD